MPNPVTITMWLPAYVAGAAAMQGYFWTASGLTFVSVYLCHVVFKRAYSKR